MSESSTAAATSGARGLRPARLLRAGVLLAIGLAIAFTAAFHEQLGFDIALAVSGLALIGAATLVEYLSLRGTAESWWVAARGIVAFGAAGAMLAATDSATMALVLALWGALTALITLLRLARGVQPFGVALPSLLLSLLLAIASFLLRDDQVAVIGFFGTYAIIRGVFLAIAAFDPRPASSAGAESAVAAGPAADPASSRADD